MNVTRIAIRRPTIAFVFVVTMLLAGYLALQQLIVQAQPAVGLPTVDVRVAYSGAPPTFVRDHIVRPLEDQIVGSPGIEHIESISELGAANIRVQYQLSSSLDADLAYTLQQLQSAKSQLPLDLLPPYLSVVDPSQGSVASIAVHSKSMSVANLAQFANVQIMPSFEKLPGIANAEVLDLPIAAFEITVDPTRLAASNLTLTDLMDTISANNVRAPGGLIYGSRQETEIDVRGDLPTAEQIGKLAIRLAPPPFAAYQSQGTTATNGVAYGGASMPSAGSSAMGSGATGGGSTLSGMGSGGMGGGAGPPIAPAMGTANQPISTGSGTSAGSGTNLVSIGNRMQQSSTAGGSYGPSSTGINVPPSTATLQSTNGSPYGSSGITAPGGLSSFGGTSSPSPSNAATIVSGSTASNLDPANAVSATAQPDASGGAGGAGYGSSGPAVVDSSASSGSQRGSGISLPPGMIASPSAQVPTAVTAATAGTSAVPAAPMPQIVSPMSEAPTLSLSPSVGALAPFAAGSPNRQLRDFANVTLGSKPVRSLTVLNGSPGVEMRMIKFASASEITVAEEIEKALPDVRKLYPKIDFHLDYVQATYSQAQVTGVEHTIVEALVLVAIIMVLFLQSWRNAVVVIIAIPTSLAVTVVVMRLLGLTLDVISLLAMSLVIGTLIDDSTVVLENIERHRDEGEEPIDAALNGRSEIGTAAVVLTLVDVVVFAPIAFFQTIVGRQLAEFGIVVSVATLTSLFVSFVVTPSLAGRWSLLSTWRPWPLVRWFDGRFEALRNWYGQKALPNAIRFQWVWIGATVLLIAGSLALIPLGVVGQEYIPAGDRPDVYVQIFYPSGTSLERTSQLTAPLDKKLNGLKWTLSVESTYGSFLTPSNVPAQEGSAAQLHVYLADGTKNETAIAQIRDIASATLPHGTQVVVFPASSETGAASRSIEEQVTHKDDTSPDADAARVADVLRHVPGTVDVVNDSANKAPQVSVLFDRDMARALDVPVGAAANAIRAAFGGATASQITTSNGLVQLDVIYPKSRQRSLDDISLVPIRTNSGQIVHVGDVARLKYSESPAILTRQDRLGAVLVSATLAPGYELSNVMRDFDDRIKALKLDDNVSVTPTATSNLSLMSDALKLIGTSLLGSFVLVYLLLVGLYNSYRTPLIILLAIPPATIGAVLSLALTHQTLNLYSLIGTLLLVGLVTKNSILLVDYANTLRGVRGLDRSDAIFESAKTRFRPILMTTLAMVFGLLPVALGLDPGASSRRALGIVVIGGLLTSLVLTLVLIPIFYRFIAPEKLKERVEFADERDGGERSDRAAPQPA